MPQPAVFNFSTYGGDQYYFEFRISDMVGTPPVKTPRNITGYTFKAEVKAAIGKSGAALVTLTTAILNATDGLVSVTLTPAMAATLSSAVSTIYYYDVQYTSGTVVRTPLRGTITIDPEVTT